MQEKNKPNKKKKILFFLITLLFLCLMISVSKIAFFSGELKNITITITRFLVFMFLFLITTAEGIYIFWNWKVIRERRIQIKGARKGMGYVFIVSPDKKTEKHYLNISEDKIKIGNKTYITDAKKVRFMEKIPYYFYIKNRAEPLDFDDEQEIALFIDKEANKTYSAQEYFDILELIEKETNKDKKKELNKKLKGLFKLNFNVPRLGEGTDATILDNLILRAKTAAGLLDFLRTNKIILVILVIVAILVLINLVIGFNTSSAIRTAGRVLSA